MWPTESFGGLSDDQFWDDLTSDKPLQRIARTAHQDSGAKHRPLEAVPATDPARGNGRRTAPAAGNASGYPGARPRPADRTAVLPAQPGPPATQVQPAAQTRAGGRGDETSPAPRPPPPPRGPAGSAGPAGYPDAASRSEAASRPGSAGHSGSAGNSARPRHGRNSADPGGSTDSGPVAPGRQPADAGRYRGRRTGRPRAPARRCGPLLSPARHVGGATLALVRTH